MGSVFLIMHLTYVSALGWHYSHVFTQTKRTDANPDEKISSKFLFLGGLGKSSLVILAVRSNDDL